MTEPILIVSTMHHRGDCAVSALATILRVPYEEVLVVAARRYPTVLVDGLVNEDMIWIAKMFGRILVERTGEEIDYRKAIGILGAHLKEQPEEDEHAVVLSHGLVFDPDSKGEIWRVRDWIRHFGATDLDLLELED